MRVGKFLFCIVICRNISLIYFALRDNVLPIVPAVFAIIPHPLQAEHDAAWALAVAGGGG